MLTIGDKIPEFNLKDQHNQEVKLSDFKGKKVLLSFHPLAWTGICTKQMKALEQNKQRFDELGLIALGISVDPVPSKHAWAKDMGVKDTKLLSDFWPHGGYAQKLGIFREKEGFSERANVLVDEEQNIIWIKIYEISQLPDFEEIIQNLNKGR